MKRSIAIMAGIRQGAGAPAPTDPLLMEPAGNVSRLPLTNFSISLDFFGLNKEHDYTESGGNTGTMPWASWRSQDSWTSWPFIEQTAGVLDSTLLTRLKNHIADVKSRGGKSVYTQQLTPKMYSTHPEVTVDEYGLASPYPPADMSDLTAHVNAILGEVGNDLSAWEGYNEPDFAYEGSMADLVTMQQTIWNAVKAWNTAHSTDIKVLSPAFSTRAHIEGAEDSMTVQGFYLAGGYDYCDAVAFHPYNSGDAGGVGVDRDSAAVLLGGLVNIGLDKPIWLTEMGRSNAATLTSLELKRHFLMWRALGVPVAFWYSWDIASLNDMRLSNNPAAWTGMVNDLVGPTFGWVSYYNDGSSAQLGALIDGVPTLI